MKLAPLTSPYNRWGRKEVMCLMLGDMAIQTQSWGLNLSLLRAQWLTYLCCTECNLALSRFLSISFCASILLPWKPAAYASSQTELHLICISQLLLSSLSTAKSSTVWTPTHTWKILWENPDSWDQKLVGEYFPLSLFVSWGKAFEVCSMWFSRWAQVGQSPGIPSGTQLRNVSLSWLSLIPVSPIQSHGGGIQKCTQVFPVGAFRLPTSPQILHRSEGQAQRKDWYLPWATYSAVFAYFLHLTVGRIQEASCCPIWQTVTSRHNVSIRFRNSRQVGSTDPDQRTDWTRRKMSPDDSAFPYPTRASEFLLSRIFNCSSWASLEEPERTWPVTHLL